MQSNNLTASVAQLSTKFDCTAADVATKFVIRLDPSTGVPEVLQGTVSCEVEGSDKKGSVVDGVKGLFGFGSKKDDQQPLNDDEDTSESSSSSKATKSSSTKSSAAASASAGDEEAPTKRTESISVSFTAKAEGLPAVSAPEVKRMKAR